MIGYRDPYTEHIDSIRDWAEFLEVLDAWHDTTARYIDLDSAPELFSHSGRYGWWAKVLAAWILDKSKVSPEPLLAITRMIQAKDPLGSMTAFHATPETIERCRQEWRPYEQILVDQAECRISGLTTGDTGNISVDIARQTVTLNGTPFDVASVQSLRWVKVLAEHPGTWITGPDLVQYDSELDGVRTDKLRPKLPASIDQLIESGTGRGSRLVLGVTMP